MTRAMFSAAADRNKGPILERLQPLLRRESGVLEIGSGTGQHAVHFASRMPSLRWTCSEIRDGLPALQAGLAERPANIPEARVLDVRGDWPRERFDAMFTANTLHIMPWSGVEAFFRGAGSVLTRGGRLIVYGPFHYAGKATSVSNAAFDRALRDAEPGRGVRDVEAIHALAAEAAFRPLADFAMPANNRLLAWEMNRVDD